MIAHKASKFSCACGAGDTTTRRLCDSPSEASEQSPVSPRHSTHSVPEPAPFTATGAAHATRWALDIEGGKGQISNADQSQIRAHRAGVGRSSHHHDTGPGAALPAEQALLSHSALSCCGHTIDQRALRSPVTERAAVLSSGGGMILLCRACPLLQLLHCDTIQSVYTVHYSALLPCALCTEP